MEWCLAAPGCDTLRNEYFSCLDRHGAEESNEHGVKAHALCESPFEALLRCGAQSVLGDIENPRYRKRLFKD